MTMRYWQYAFLAIGILFLVGTLLVAAQDGTEVSDAACSPPLEVVWTTASDACLGGPAGYVCNGGAAPQVEPAGPVSNALISTGALVEVTVVDSLRTPPLNSGGLMWLRLPDLSGLLVGAVSVRDVSPPDIPAWKSIVVETLADSAGCGAAPRNTFVLQSAPDQETGIIVNGLSLALNGTIAVQTTSNSTILIGLSGQSSLLTFGQQQLWTGQQMSVAYNPGDFTAPAAAPAPPQPLDVNLIRTLPVALLDRAIILPQPGYVMTDGLVNLRAEPSRDGTLLLQVPAGEVLSVLGRNTLGDWYHVRLDSGETGWMLAELLVQNLGAIQAIYEATPLPPQRFGELGRIGRVLAPAGVNLRQAPDVGFPAITSLPDGTPVVLVARSPYSPWVKVQVNGIEGWLALVTLETEVVVDALPIDYNVPPPPNPTRVPGSFGNAFPDPNAGG
jgi:uncharacterized protein YgiM (DUF1202 family)